MSIIQVIKDRPLDSRWRDNDYPTSFVPFYLYGTGARFFVDHALVKAPNAQMCAEVNLDLNVSLDPAQHERGLLPERDLLLTRGLLLSVLRPEVAMQPADAASTRWFASGASYKVAVYTDPNSATAHGPGLVSEIVHGSPIATGTMTIVGHPFVDFVRLNTQDFTGLKTHRFTSFTSRATHPEHKEQWRKLVRALGHRHGRV